MEIMKLWTGYTDGYPALCVNGWAGQMTATFSCLDLYGGKTQRASALWILFGICKHVFSFKCSECIWILGSYTKLYNALSPKNLFSVKHYTCPTWTPWRRWFGISWATEHMGSFMILSLGRAVCELRTVYFLLSNVNIIVFEFLNHFSIIWAFTLYFYKHIHTAVALRRKETSLTFPHGRICGNLFSMYIYIPIQKLNHSHSL